MKKLICLALAASLAAGLAGCRSNDLDTPGAEPTERKDVPVLAVADML